MDDTPIDDLVSELDAADPADAPDLADEVAAALAARLEALRVASQDPSPAYAAEDEEDSAAPQA